MSGGDDSLQTIVFGIERELFALPVNVVREILDHRSAFRVPNAPDWLLGLCEVRGRAVPMIDFRVCLGLPAVAPTPTTRVLVVEADTGGERRIDVGLVVDRVADVSTWTADMIEPVPETGTAWRSHHVSRVLRRDGRIVGLLELRGIFAGMDQTLSQPGSQSVAIAA